MEKKRETIWNKSWPGWFGSLSWMTLLFVAASFTLFATALVAKIPSTTIGEILACSLAIGFGASVALTLGVAFTHWACCWRNFRRFLFALVCFITLIALFYAEENIRGTMAWDRYVKQLAARGEMLDLMQLVPKPIPDDENFFMTPLWAPMQFKKVDGHTVWADTNWHANPFEIVGRQYGSDAPDGGNYRAGRHLDLRQWQEYYLTTPRQDPHSTNAASTWFSATQRAQSPAADVLLALSSFDDSRELLIAASMRPNARFWVDYDAGFSALLPHLSRLKSISQYLALHSVAAMQAGDPETALQDLKLSFRLIDSIRTEPILISHLVRIAMLQISLQPVWEGLAEHRWSDSQLAAIESQLRQLDFLADYRLSLRGERAFDIWTIDYAESNRKSGFGDLFDSEWLGVPAPIGPRLFQAIPKGWFDQNKLTLARTLDDILLPLVDMESRTIQPSASGNANEAVARMEAHRNISNYASRLFLPAVGNAVKKFALGQASADLARTAIAIERHRLAAGKYPESLDSLIPEYIAAVPHDVINGEPLHYERTPDGRFVLYSVGWNETDDGGEVALIADGKRTDVSEGDWVWQYPED